MSIYKTGETDYFLFLPWLSWKVWIRWPCAIRTFVRHIYNATASQIFSKIQKEYYLNCGISFRIHLGIHSLCSVSLFLFSFFCCGKYRCVRFLIHFHISLWNDWSICYLFMCWFDRINSSNWRAIADLKLIYIVCLHLNYCLHINTTAQKTSIQHLCQQLE